MILNVQFGASNMGHFGTMNILYFLANDSRRYDDTSKLKRRGC